MQIGGVLLPKKKRQHLSNMENKEYFTNVIDEIRQEAISIESVWNGYDTRGRVEERAMISADIIKACNELEELIKNV